LNEGQTAKVLKRVSKFTGNASGNLILLMILEIISENRNVLKVAFRLNSLKEF
jgi:hypothetical protein